MLTTRLTVIVALAASVLSLRSSFPQDDETWRAAAAYEQGWSRSPLRAIERDVLRAAGGEADEPRRELERRLLDLVSDERATPAGRAFACRQLALVGGDDSVPVLGGLLLDEAVGPTARSALEAIPGDTAGEALCAALPEARGETRLGLLASIGARREACGVGAIGGLIDRLEGPEQAAALAALGRIGSDEALRRLMRRPSFDWTADDPPVADAFVAALERRVRGGGARDVLNTSQLAYGVIEAPAPAGLQAAGLQLLALTAPRAAAGLAVERLDETSPALRGAAARILIELPDASIVRECAEKLADLPPARQAALLEALAARGDPETAPAVARLAEASRGAARVAALEALASIGGAEHVPMLVTAAAGGEDAARAALARLRGAAVNRTLGDLVAAAPVAERIVIVETIGERLAREEQVKVAALTADDQPSAVRTIAFLTLARLHPPSDEVGPQRSIRRAAGAAQTAREKAWVLETLARHEGIDMLPVAMVWLDDAAVGRAAAEVAIALSRSAAREEVDTALAALEEVMNLHGDDAALREQAGSAASHVERHVGFIRSWARTGSYSQPDTPAETLFDVAFAPELDESDELVGLEGFALEPVSWQAIDEQDLVEPGIVDFARLLGGEHRVAYLRTVLVAGAEVAARLEIGSDDGVKAWLNGELVHANNAMRGLTPGEDVVAVTLREGRNELLLKVTQGSGDWRACCRLRDAEGFRMEGVEVE